jgi:hypothetical protein
MVIPVELLEYIFLLSSEDDYKSLSLSCSLFYEILNEDIFWKRKYPGVHGKTLSQKIRNYKSMIEARELTKRIREGMNSHAMTIYLREVINIKGIDIEPLNLSSLSKLIDEDKEYTRIKKKICLLPRTERFGLEEVRMNFNFVRVKLYLEEEPYLVLGVKGVDRKIFCTWEQMEEFIVRLILHNVITKNRVLQVLSEPNPFFLVS